MLFFFSRLSLADVAHLSGSVRETFANSISGLPSNKIKQCGKVT